jgi:hypothetical protein
MLFQIVIPHTLASILFWDIFALVLMNMVRVLEARPFFTLRCEGELLSMLQHAHKIEDNLFGCLALIGRKKRGLRGRFPSGSPVSTRADV